VEESVAKLGSLAKQGSGNGLRYELEGMDE